MEYSGRGVVTRGGKVAPGRGRRGVSVTQGGSGTHGIHIHEPDSRSTLGRHGSQEFSSNGKGKKVTEGEYRQTCGRYVVIRDGKGGGAASSRSRLVSSDEMADTAGVVRNRMTIQNIEDDENVDEDNYDEDDASQDDASQDEDDAGEIDGSGKIDGSRKDDGGDRWIARKGDKFGSGRVHRSAGALLDQKIDGDWITFKMVPHSVLREMFNTFRTQWIWDPRDDQHIFEGFVNVLKGRYPDKMNDLREESKMKARADNHVIEDGKHRFDIICKYPPKIVPLERWESMCKMWNTEKWLNRSKAGKNNRKNDLSRHTGGSMGIDEHRIRLEKQKGGPVGYEVVFIDTHATKETKKRLRDGEININDHLEQLEFVTTRSKKSFTSFHKELEKEYGSNNDDRDEYAVWKRLHPKSRGRMFGIGSSDPHFVVTGSQSSFYGSTSYGDARQSKEFKDVQAKFEKAEEARRNLENRLEQREIDAEKERAEREKLQSQMERDLEIERAEREKERAEREKERAEREKLQKQVEEILKRLADK